METEIGVMYFEGDMNQRSILLQQIEKGKEVNLPLGLPDRTKLCLHHNVTL